MADERVPNLVVVTANITAAFVSNNGVDAQEVSELISSIYKALAFQGGMPYQEAQPSKLVGAVSVRKSTSSREHIISMIDGRSYKTLTRHVTKYGYTPQSYREAFGLPSSYPMTAPAYSEKRSAMAKAIRLGEHGHRKETSAPMRKISRKG